MTGTPIEVWRGCANAWECDHVGHLNTRNYIVRVEQSLAALAQRLEIADAAHCVGTHRLLVKAQYMRFLREVRAGTALHATAQVLSWGMDDAQVLFVFYHSIPGQVAATFRLSLEHVEHGSGCPTPWPERATRAAAALTCEAPREAMPRSVSLDRAEVTTSLERARQWGMRTTGFGAIMPDACDADGQWRLSAFMERVSDSIPHLRNGDWLKVLAETTPGGPTRVSSALTELHAVHVRWPKAGACCEVRSALAGCTERVTYASHWLLDRQTGAPWAAVRTVSIPIDLDARRALPLTAEAQAAFRAFSVEGLEY
jgi:acyl-CoA thioester hydrolase